MVSCVPCTACVSRPTAAGAAFSLSGNIDVSGTRILPSLVGQEASDALS